MILPDIIILSLLESEVRTITYPDFSYSIPTYNYSNIEDDICSRCNIGFPNTSNLPHNVENRYAADVFVLASEGKASCHITVTKLASGEYEILITRLSSRH